MRLIFIIIFAVLGIWLAAGSHTMLGLGVGAMFGYLVGRVRDLEAKLSAVNAELRRIAPAKPATPATDRVARPTGTPKPLIETETDAEPAKSDLRPARSAVPETDSTGPDLPGLAIKLFRTVKEWVTSGNVPVKVGVIVSFFGVSFLLKYAIDQQFLSFPIELRYLGVAIAASILLGIGWRLRDSNRTYALSLQGGGIGILYLTIFAAFRLHPLLPPVLAFPLLVLLTVSAGMLAVLQDSRWLAILGTVGGFLAPVLVSTGAGNHVALFSYYLLLNAAILGIAWFKLWRSLNVIGFIFTFGVASMWGYEYYRPEYIASTEPFLVAFFLFYQAIAILFAFRQPPRLRGLVDGTLLFGTPVIAFALQARLVSHTEYGLAISAIIAAVLYIMVGAWLYRIRREQMRLLIESYVALEIAFATIAIPLALDSRWTAVAWALEGAALVWVGVRQNGFLARIAGFALIGASGIAFLNDGWRNDAGLPVLNGNVLGGMLISIASLFSARQLAVDEKPVPLQAAASVLLFVWGLGWWAAIGAAEIFDRVSGTHELPSLVAFAAASAVLFAWLGKRLQWAAPRRATLAYLPLLAILGLISVAVDHHLFAGAGAFSWVAAVGAHFVVLKAYEHAPGKLAATWHLAGVLLISAALTWEVLWRMDHANFSFVWMVSTAMTIPIAAILLITYGRRHLQWPLQRHWNTYVSAAGILVSLQLLASVFAGLVDAGDPVPLPYIPLANPFDLLSAIGLTVALHVVFVWRSSTKSLGEGQYRLALIALSLGAFVLSTISVVRGVHIIGNIDWQQNTLMRSVAVQSALSIYWAILGLGGMVWGTRHARRWLWLSGAGLMVLVVAKLFLVDLGNSGTVARIVSFLGVGVMLLVVGYFSPAPPRSKVPAESLVEE